MCSTVGIWINLFFNACYNIRIKMERKKLEERQGCFRVQGIQNYSNHEMLSRPNWFGYTHPALVLNRDAVNPTKCHSTAETKIILGDMSY